MRNPGIAALLDRTLGLPGSSDSRIEAGISHFILHRGSGVNILNSNGQVFKNCCEILRKKLDGTRGGWVARNAVCIY